MLQKYGIKEMVDLLTGDIRATIVFLDTECSETEFIWMSEIFDEIAERTKSREFIEAFRRTAKRFPEAAKDYNLEYFNHRAESMLKTKDVLFTLLKTRPVQ